MPETAFSNDYRFSPEVPNYNMRIGAVDFAFGIGLGVEFNDNIRLAPSGEEQSDIILRPFADLSAMWRVTELNTLNLNLGVGYSKYLDNSDLDSGGLLVTPNSSISFQFFVGDFRITLSDTFSYQEDTTTTPELSDTGVFKRFENQVGVQVDWNANQNLIITTGYTHYDLWVVDNEEFETAERSIDTVYVRPSIQISPTITAGLNTSASWITFKSDERDDSFNVFVGPFVDMQITDYTSARLEVGWQQFNSQGPSGDTGSIYVRAEINNQLTSAFTHRIAFQRSNEVGILNERYEINRLEYGMAWALLPSITLNGDIFYENYSGSGEGADSGDRFGLSLGVGYQLTRSITLGASYRFLTKESDQPQSDYTQNSFVLTLAYRF